MSWRNAALIGGVFAGIIVVSLIARSNDKIDDQALRVLLVGSWRATDVDTAAISALSGPIAKEEFIVNPDGTLKHIVIPHAGKGEASSDNYEWKVTDGKLCLRRIGQTGEGNIPPIGITVDQSRLRLRSGGFSTKVFERVTS